MIVFKTGKYFGDVNRDGNMDIFSSKGNILFTITPKSKIYSYIDRVLRENYEDYFIDAEIDDEVRKMESKPEIIITLRSGEYSVV